MSRHSRATRRKCILVSAASGGVKRDAEGAGGAVRGAADPWARIVDVQIVGVTISLS